MADQLAPFGRRSLVFDGDGSQYAVQGSLCAICNKLQRPGDDPPSVFIRVREKLASGRTRELMQVCPDCVARMFLQTTRLDLWNQVSGAVLAAIRRLLHRKWKGAGHEDTNVRALPPRALPAPPAPDKESAR